MSLRMLIFTGIITAHVGALLGVIVVHIAEKESRQTAAILVGSTVGFAIGVGYEAIQQNRELD
ncbi:MAG: hypothetical protein HC930_17110 [Hydrococcus sp. SU_1_0]|nr:hypothetical protein [Hydrococcus sp. SU_1_0]